MSGVNQASVLLVQKYARSVLTLVQNPLAPKPHDGLDAEFLLPALTLDEHSLVLKKMTDQRSAAVTAGMARPFLVGNNRHDDVKRAVHIDKFRYGKVYSRSRSLARISGARREKDATSDMRFGSACRRGGVIVKLSLRMEFDSRSATGKFHSESWA